MSTRMYLVTLTKKKVLVEASSQEMAIRTATKSMVKSVTIPTPLEVARMLRDEVEVISPTLAAQKPAVEPEKQSEGGEGVGRMGLAAGQPGNATDGDDSGGQQSEAIC
jgi:hypothetical protein